MGIPEFVEDGPEMQVACEVGQSCADIAFTLWGLLTQGS